jgi:hypothetical protein
VIPRAAREPQHEPLDDDHRIGQTWANRPQPGCRVIRPPAGRMEGRPYDDGNGRTTGLDFAKAVARAGTDRPGMYLYASGAATGVDCVLRIDPGAPRGLFDVRDYRDGQQRLDFEDDTVWAWMASTVGSGDGGGPVFSLALTEPSSRNAASASPSARPGRAWVSCLAIPVPRSAVHGSDSSTSRTSWLAPDSMTAEGSERTPGTRCRAAATASPGVRRCGSNPHRARGPRTRGPACAPAADVMLAGSGRAHGDVWTRAG